MIKASAGLLVSWLAAASLTAVPFTVTNTNDSGAGSLREAIALANASAGLDTINFNIPGVGVHTISPLTQLLEISDAVIIDGYSQPGASPNTDPNGFNGTLLIELSGAAGPPMNGLNIQAGGSTVRGLVINRFAGLTTDTGNAIRLGAGAGNHVEGNFLGTDASGTIALANEDDAIIVGTADNVIGGTTPAARNVISASGRAALFILTAGNIIQGNFIGTQKDGLSPLGNQQGIGFVGNGGFASNNTIGGTGPGEANVIAFSSIRGIVGISGSGTGNSIRGNSIHDNGELGIDLLEPIGPTANDPGDVDPGFNNLQNFPIVKLVEHLGPQGADSTRIVGKLDSMPSTTFGLDFYSNPACSNFPREFVEGETYLGFSQVTTDGSGHANIDVTFPVLTEAGARITMTATDPGGNTSELSQRILFSISPASGPSAGGTPIDANGTDFANPTGITFGATPATGVTFVNDHQLSFTSPALPPGTVHDVIATTPDGTTGRLVKGWVSDFLDVPPSHPYYSYVTNLVSNAITAGVGGGNYGVDLPTLREQMAVFLVLAKDGLCFIPPACTTPTFADVPCSSPFAVWIEELVARGVTAGCGGGNYCPAGEVTREQMAVFLLVTLEGPTYTPLACTIPTFSDVPCSSPFAPWIEDLVARLITAGCGGGLYCPLQAVTRGEMAVFLTVTFSIPF